MGGKHADKSGNCEICGVWRRVLQRDRRRPGYLGGQYEPSNIQWLCANCHQDKTALEMSAVHKGKPKSPEHRAKMSAWQIGKKLSPETKEKIRQKNLAFHAAKPEARAEHGERMKAVWAERGGPPSKGKPMTDAQKAKIRATLVEHNAANPKPRAEPWIAEGISKTQWYRRLKRAAETPEETIARRAARMEKYHANIEAERAAMRIRLRDYYRRKANAKRAAHQPSADILPSS